MDALQRAIEDVTAGVALRPLQSAVEALSARYRDADAGCLVRPLSDLERTAYLSVRMPATAAALAHVLEELARRATLPVRSLLDLGSGPGTSLWAADQALPTLGEVTLVDADGAMLALGERLWQQHPLHDTVRVRWERAALDRAERWPAHDLVLLSYVVGELAADASAVVLSHAQEAARIAVVIVEPGTPRGCARVLSARDTLASSGWHILAPCPHDRACPLRAASESGSDWCHFAARLGRSRAHRQLKGGELGWEDEKFSYVIAVPTARPTDRVEARVIRRPTKGTGHVKLALCTPEGLVERVVTRRDRDAYRRARDVRWGDGW